MSTITVNLEIKKQRVYFTCEGIFNDRTIFSAKEKTFKETRESLEKQIVDFFETHVKKDVNLMQHTFKDFGKNKICEISYKVTWIDEINKSPMNLQEFKELITKSMETPGVKKKRKRRTKAEMEAARQQVPQVKKRKRRTKAEMEIARQQAAQKQGPVKKKRKRRTKAEMEAARARGEA